MNRRTALLVSTGVLLVGFLIVFVGSLGDSPPSATLQSTSVLPATSTGSTAPTVTQGESMDDGRRAALPVLAYWAAYGSGDSKAIQRMLDVTPAQQVKEIGLVEYSAAFGGEYVATCRAGAVVGDEIAVDCDVGAVNQPLAAALNIGVTPTQFRVRGDKITRVGYLKPYSLIDLQLAAFVRGTNEESLLQSCSNPEGIYLADSGVVYNAECGRFMASFADEYIASLD